MVDLINLTEADLYPTEKFGPSLEGTLLYKVRDQSHFPGAYMTTNERLFMNVDMNGEAYTRVFAYQDIVRAYVEDEVLFIEFPEGMGKIAMVETVSGDIEAFADYVNDKAGN